MIIQQMARNSTVANMNFSYVLMHLSIIRNLLELCALSHSPFRHGANLKFKFTKFQIAHSLKLWRELCMRRMKVETFSKVER